MRSAVRRCPGAASWSALRQSERRPTRWSGRRPPATPAESCARSGVTTRGSADRLVPSFSPGVRRCRLGPHSPPKRTQDRRSLVRAGCQSRALHPCPGRRRVGTTPGPSATADRAFDSATARAWFHHRRHRSCRGSAVRRGAVSKVRGNATRSARVPPARARLPTHPRPQAHRPAPQAGHRPAPPSLWSPAGARHSTGTVSPSVAPQATDTAQADCRSTRAPVPLGCRATYRRGNRHPGNRPNPSHRASAARAHRQRSSGPQRRPPARPWARMRRPVRTQSMMSARASAAAAGPAPGPRQRRPGTHSARSQQPA